MRYISTRGGGRPQTFCETLLGGLAEDGGLSVPQQVPALSVADLARLRSLWQNEGYVALALALFEFFIDDIPQEDLRALTAQAYTQAAFGDARITPLSALKNQPGMYLLELSNGPTLAFKDIAMQWLGVLFEYVLSQRNERLNILGATSGDTGSAAEYAMRARSRLRVFMLSPQGRMSAFQRAQMYSLQDANIYNIAIAGNFDDCQDIVKALASDNAFRARAQIGAVNSINWARILAQSVYYFAAYFQATEANGESIHFAVPTGNFGDIYAGHLARRMGLPIDQLILATNENNVLEEFFARGLYHPRKDHQVLATSSPSMDIAKASNFERFVFDACAQNPERVRALFGTTLINLGAFALQPPEFARAKSFGFIALRCDHAQRLEAIRACAQISQRIIDPHTACAWHAATALCNAGTLSAEGKIVILETAAPAKFAETIEEATGTTPPRPATLNGLELLPQRFTPLPAQAEMVRRFIEQTLAGAS